MKTIENKIYLEFTRSKSDSKIRFEDEGCNIKKIIENDNFIKGDILYDCDGNEIGDYIDGEVDYCYDEGAAYEWYGRWYASADGLSEEEAKAILKESNDTDYTYVKWAKELLCLDDDDD